MNRLRISIAPEVKEVAGPAVAWTWRQLLATAGFGWEETSIDAACDVAYVVRRGQAPGARIEIAAALARWRAPTTCRLAALAASDPRCPLRFDGEAGDAVAVELDDDRLWLPRDLLFDLFWLLTGQEERHWPQDAHGFRDLTGSVGLRERILERAPGGALIEGFQALIHERLGLTGEPRWPQTKRAAAAITHDVDYPEVIRWLEPLRIFRRQGRAGLRPAWEVLAGRRTHWAFPQWLAFEAHYGVRSAFYFVARQGSLVEYARGTPDPFYDVTTSRFRTLFRTLIDGGWEVGMHASYLAYAARERFAGEKARLEAAAGAPVLGNRHHYWHLNPVDPEETLQMHADIGLRYDTSLTHDRYLGWRRGVTTPFYPFVQATQREIAAVQLPVAWMDAQLAQRTDLTQAQRDASVTALVDRVAQQQGLFVANVHDYVFDDTLFPGWLATLRAALERITARGDFWLATPATIAQHWTARYGQLLAQSSGLEEGC